MQDITVAELRSRLDGGEKIHVVDVREPDEYAAFNIGVTLLPLGNVMSLQLGEAEDWDRDEEVVVLCRSGKRSLQAGMMLETIGFTNVKNLAGGMVEWQATAEG